MYLLVFTFLVIGVLGIYTQVAAVEAARIAQSQSGIGQALLTWHEAAASLAGNIVSPPTLGVTGCSLTTVTGAAAFLPCAYNGAKVSGPHISGPVPTAVSVNGGAYTLLPAGTAPTFPDILGGYNPAYSWKSVAYLDPAGTYYVVTYVDPVAGGGFISTATTTIGVTQADLYRQLQNTGIPAMNMGYTSVVGGKNMLITTSWINMATGPTQVSYRVPAAIPVNSLAIISQPSPCPTC